MSGSVRPLVGRTPMLTPMLMNAWDADQKTETRREIRRELEPVVGGQPRDLETAPDEREEQRQRRDHADEAQFFGQHREQEIRVCLGQVEELLYALAESDAEPLAPTDRDQRLRQLHAAV